jgi:hypothetical protein
LNDKRGDDLDRHVSTESRVTRPVDLVRGLITLALLTMKLADAAIDTAMWASG